MQRALSSRNSLERFSSLLRDCERSARAEYSLAGVSSEWHATFRMTSAESTEICEIELVKVVEGAQRRWEKRAVAAQFTVTFDPAECAIQITQYPESMVASSPSHERTSSTISEVVHEYWEHPLRCGIRPESLLGAVPPPVIPAPTETTSVYSKKLPKGNLE